VRSGEEGDEDIPLFSPDLRRRGSAVFVRMLRTEPVAMQRWSVSWLYRCPKAAPVENRIEYAVNSERNNNDFNH